MLHRAQWRFAIASQTGYHGQAQESDSKPQIDQFFINGCPAVIEHILKHLRQKAAIRSALCRRNEHHFRPAYSILSRLVYSTENSKAVGCQPSHRAGWASYTHQTIRQALSGQTKQNRIDFGWRQPVNWDLNGKKLRECRVRWFMWGVNWRFIFPIPNKKFKVGC
jgi:hypothetical protein